MKLNSVLHRSERMTSVRLQSRALPAACLSMMFRMARISAKATEARGRLRLGFVQRRDQSELHGD